MQPHRANDEASPGPGGRTDAEIAHVVETTLSRVTNLPKAAIQVTVNNGWVRLSGTVDWDYQRINIDAAVRSVAGVSRISDNITLVPRRPFTAIKADVEAALEARSAADLGGVTVDVRGAYVTLSGNIRGWWQRGLARQSAWSTPGVKHVVDNLTIRD
jgi:osmotically-inducible protein OsmY